MLGSTTGTYQIKITGLDHDVREFRYAISLDKVTDSKMRQLTIEH